VEGGGEVGVGFVFVLVLEKEDSKALERGSD